MDNSTVTIMQRMFTALNSNYTEAIEKNTDQFSRILLELSTIENFKKWGECWIEEVKMINVLFSIRLYNNINSLKSETIRQLKEDAIDMDLRGLINE